MDRFHFQPGLSRTLTFPLHDGAEASILVTQRASSVPAKARYGGRAVRDAEGRRQYITVPVRMVLVRVRIGLQDFVARACCKPGDRFDLRTGIELASRRLVRAKSFPSKYTREVLERLCPHFFVRTTGRSSRVAETAR